MSIPGSTVLHLALALAWLAPRPGAAAAPAEPLHLLGNERLPPYIWVEDGQPRGLVVDIARAMAERAALDIRIEALEWPRAQALVQAGAADALLQINPSPEREQLYDFSAPLLESHFHLFRQAHRTEIRDLASLAGRRVGVEAGGLPLQHLRRDGRAEPVVIPSWQVGFEMLRAGELDAVFADRWVGEYVLHLERIGRGRGEGIAVVEPAVLTSAARIAVAKGNRDLLARIDAGLGAIEADGTRARILARWRGQEVVYVTRELLDRVELLGAGAFALFLVVVTLMALSHARGLRRANRLLAERGAALEDLHARLEGRVAERTAELQAHTERYELVLAGANDAIWDWDVPGARVHYSARWLALRGYAPGELDDREAHWRDGIHPEDAARVQAALQAHLEGASPVFAEQYRVRRRDGAWIWVQDQGLARRDAAGRVVRMAGSERDVTAARRAEALLRAHLQIATAADLEALLRAAVDAAEAVTDSAIGYFHFVEPDQQGLSLQTWSTRTLAGACRAEGAGLHYPIDRAGVWVDCLREGRPVTHNDYAALPHRRGLPDGHVPLVREMAVPVYRDGLAVAILGVGNKGWDYDGDDLAAVSYLAQVAMERVAATRTDAALRETQQRLHLALEAAFLISFEWDVQRDQVRRLVSGEPALAPTPADAPDTFGSVLAAVHPDDRPAFTAAVEAALADPLGHYQNEFRVVRPDGRQAWLHESGRVEFDAQGRPLRLLGLSQDVTARREAEGQLRDQLEELRRANQDLARFNRVSVGRELRMIELKGQVNALLVQAGQPPRYPLAFEPRPDGDPAPAVDRDAQPRPGGDGLPPPGAAPGDKESPPC